MIAALLLLAVDARAWQEVSPVTAPGFQVERVHRAAPGQGSWVAACFDDQGRLIVSDQGAAGLFRLTLPGPVLRGEDVLGWTRREVLVEPLPVDLSSANGLLFHRGALYAVVCGGDRPGSGLHRVTDTDGDGLPDTLSTLTPLTGDGEHGWHAVLATPDGDELVVVGGNLTVAPALAGSAVPLHWGEDLLLPRLSEPSGFMLGHQAPGGCIYRVSLDGSRWALHSMGFRNPYDAAFHPSGDLFTADADMEWDLNTPWYRPPRVALVASGSDHGWRAGSGKWPEHHLDGTPPVSHLPLGSPTGVAFAHDARFPDPWRGRLLVADWSQGRVLGVDLHPDGAGWRGGEAQTLVRGTPLPVADLAVSPVDGALYLVTGGRDLPSEIWRVSHPAGRGSEDVALPHASQAAAARAQRRELESLHRPGAPDAVETVWPYLGSADFALRAAARIALEWQPTERWRARALSETRPTAALAALAALARASGGDPERRDGPPVGADAELRRAVLERLLALPWDELSLHERQDVLRVTALALLRLGAPESDLQRALLACWEPRFPTDVPALDGALCELLVFLQSPSLAARAVPRLSEARTQEEQLDLARSLRHLRAGFPDDLRRDALAWAARARQFKGGESLQGFIMQVRDDLLAGLDDPSRREVLSAEHEALVAAGGDDPPTPSLLAGRTELREHTVEGLLPALRSALAPGAPARDPARGRQLFAAVDCFRCHRVAGEGGAVGPDLSAVSGRFSPADLLRAVLDPDATVSDQYAQSVIILDDGEQLTGRVVNLVGETLMVNTDMFQPGRLRYLDRKRVTGLRPSSVSPMPAGLLAPLTSEEVIDLLVWLQAPGDDGTPDGR